MLVVLLISVSVFAAEGSGSSLNRLIGLAEENSPVIVKSRLGLEQARLELKTARAKLFPTLDLESVHGPLQKNPDPDHRVSNMTSSISLTLKENFYDNGASITRYKLAARKLERLTLQYEWERDEQLLKLVNTYYDWSAAWQDRRISDGKRELLKKQFNILEAQYKQGLKTKRDVLRIETEVRRLQIDLLRKDNELEVTLQRLSAQAGVSRESLRSSGVASEEAKQDSLYPTGPWPALNAVDHRRAKIFSRQSEEAELEVRLVEREYWPRIDLTGYVKHGYSGYADTGVRFDETRSWEIAGLVTLKYNLWDWGTRSRDLQISRVKEQAVQADSKQGLLDLDIELRDVWLKLKEFSESVKMTKDLLAIEQQSFNILEAEHRSGRATYLDLITNLNSLIDARSKFATTFFALKKQQATYAFHKGTLYEDLKPK